MMLDEMTDADLTSIAKWDDGREPQREPAQIEALRAVLELAGDDLIQSAIRIEGQQ